MTTATLTSARSSQIAAMLWSISHAFFLALRYTTLFQMNDAELAARGLAASELSKNFLDETAKI